MPLGPSSGGLEFAVGLQGGLQGGLEGWCQLLMTTEVDSVHHRWLQELIVCVSVCSSELQASEALVCLLCAGGGKEQLPTLLVLYWELQIRYPNVAMTMVNCALSAIQHTEEEEGRLKLLDTFSKNMLVVLNGLQPTDARSMHIRYDHDNVIN